MSVLKSSYIEALYIYIYSVLKLVILRHYIVSILNSSYIMPLYSLSIKI